MPAFLIDTDWIIDHFNGHATKAGRPAHVATQDANLFDSRCCDESADAGVVILTVEFENFSFGLVEPERDVPVAGDSGAPGSLSVGEIPRRARPAFCGPIGV